MTAPQPPGPEPAAATVTVAVRVSVPPAAAFAAFTAEIDRWWRRGPKYRHAGGALDAAIHIEPRAGGRIYETWSDGGSAREFVLGTVRAWQPGELLVYGWRNATFAPLEETEVEVTFAAAGSGTLVTVRHRGFEKLRKDHPARHGLDDVAFARSLGRWWGEQLSALRESV